jgi:hypothetical protein
MGRGAISRLFYMLILFSTRLCANAVTVDYQFTGAFVSDFAAKDGIFSAGSDFISGRLSYTTEDWIVDPVSCPVDGQACVSSTALLLRSSIHLGRIARGKVRLVPRVAFAERC